jgi:hypothetical protein
MGSPSSAFLFGLTAGVLHQETKIVAHSEELRRAFGRKSQRFNCVIGVVYIGANSPANIFEAGWSDTSRAFRDFICSLGELRVSLRAADGVHVPVVFWQNLLYSVTFQIAPLILESGLSAEDLSDKLADSPVLITWFEGGESRRGPGDHAVHIIVQPAENPPSVRISVHKRDPALRFALVDTNLTVPIAFAGLVVRWTVVLASAALRTSGPAKRHGDRCSLDSKGIWHKFPPSTCFSFHLE